MGDSDMDEKGAHAAYICDLPLGLSENELRQLFGHYGEITGLEQVEYAGQEAAVVHFSTTDSVEEAASFLNLGVVRGKTCRCLPLDSVGKIIESLESGCRLVIEDLDPSVEVRGLRDVCALFGPVLDCKVELDDKDHSRGLGFVHYAHEPDAVKALGLISGMRIGDATVALRPFGLSDESLFSGCLYDCAATRAMAPSLTAAAAAAARGDGTGDGEIKERVIPPTPLQRQQVALEHFKSLEYHHVEVVEGRESKLQRLKALIETYDPNQDRQMLVAVNEENMPCVLDLVREVVEQADLDSVSRLTPKTKWRQAVEGFQTGNVYILVAASDVCSRRDFNLGRPAAVLVNFDFPSSVGLHVLRSFQRADAATRLHSFFSPATDRSMALKLMGVLEDAGHEIPAPLLELWSASDPPE